MDHASESSTGNSVFIQTAPYSKEMRVTHSNPENTHICPQYFEPTTHYTWESPTEDEDEGDEKRRGSEDDHDDDDDHHQDHHHLTKFILEVCEKFPESVRNHLNLEELIAILKKKDKHHPKSKIKVTTTSRGGKGALDELFMKLEKFKVRTIIVDETSTEGQEDQGSK